MKAVILYLPVLHAGHLDFCKRQNPDSLFVLGETIIKEFQGKPPFLERDLRALSPEQILVEAKAINLSPRIEILELDKIKELEKYEEVVLSQDEIGEWMKKNLSKPRVIFDNTFLRWNNTQALSKKVPDSSQNISKEKLDGLFMSKAMQEAKLSPDWWRQVGALIVKDGEVILQGWNKHLPSNYSAYIDGDPRSSFNAGERIDLSLALHGEAGIIAEAAKKGVSLEGTDIYVTTFPCPNCARMIANTGIKKVFYRDGYSLLDADKILKNANVELIRVEE